MVGMKEYDEHYENGYNNYPEIHHILLSNCYLQPRWIEETIDEMNRCKREVLWIGVDV